MCTYTQKERKNKTIAFGNAKRIKAFLNAPKTKLKQYILTQQKTQQTKTKPTPKPTKSQQNTQSKHQKSHPQK